MPFAKKSDAIKSDGTLKAGYSSTVGKDGRIRYFSRSCPTKCPTKKKPMKKKKAVKAKK